MIDTKKIKRFVLLNIPYVFLWWFFAKVGEAYRLSPGRDTLRKLIGTVSVLNTAFAHPLPTMNLFDITVGLIGAAAIFCAVLYRRLNAKKWRKDIEYGSARWGNRKDIEPFVDPTPDKNVILTATESIMLNGRPANPKHARNKNVLIIGGSGSGKTRFWLKPNLMQMHSSYVVTDPKGTVLIETGKMLQRGGYEIKVLNTIDFNKSMHYNPFAYIRSEKDILKFVTALIANTKGEGKGGDDFWVKAETLLYCALVGAIHFEAPPSQQNMNTLVELINSMETREDDENFKNAVDYYFEELELGNEEEGLPPKPDCFAVRQYKKYKLAAGKTAKSILISCGARLAVFDIKELRELMAYDEMTLDTIGDKKTALFIIISDTDDSFSFIAALMYSQLFNLLCDHADNDCGGRLPVHVRCLLDEFANIGQIPKFEKLIATIRSREISACVILQAQSQLKAIYKDNAETIIGNCDATLFLGGKEKTTLKDLSESLGKETIYLLNNSVSKGSSPSFSQNQQKLGKELMSLDELSVMDGGKCILQVRGVRPFLSDKFDITKHKNYKLLSDANPKNAFNIERFVSTRLKVKPEDEYPVFNYVEPDAEMPSEAYGVVTSDDEETEEFSDYQDLEPV